MKHIFLKKLGFLVGLLSLLSFSFPLQSVASEKSFVMEEEFCGGTVTTGQIGTHGWSIRTIANAPTVAFIDGVHPHLCAITVTTATAQGDGGALLLDGASGVGGLGNLSSNTRHELRVIAGFASTANTQFRVGLVKPGTTTILPTDGVYIRYDTSLGDTKFTLCVRVSSGSETCEPTTVTASTGYHTFGFASSKAGEIRAEVDNVSVGVATGFGTTSYVPGIIFATDTTAAKTLTVDYISFTMALPTR